MAKEKSFSRVKVLINDIYERFVENERFTGVAIKFLAEDNKFVVDIPKERKRTDSVPDKWAEGEKTEMYFSKGVRGFNFNLKPDIKLFKAIGEEAVVDEFANVLHAFMEKVRTENAA